MEFIALQAGLFISLLAAFASGIYYLGRERVLQQKLFDSYRKLDALSVERARKARSLALAQTGAEERGLGRILKREAQRYVYSGLERRFPGLRFEFFLLSALVSAGCLYFSLWILTRNPAVGILGATAYLLGIRMAEAVLAARAYRAVDRSLAEFLEFLGNYSITSGEVTRVFLQISRFMPEPLCSALEECYYDAQTSGDASSALYALASKIEHPRFKEIICHIESCAHYSANYKKLVSSCRRLVAEEQRSKRERKAVGDEAVVTMVIMSGLLLAAFGIVGGLIESPIWDILFKDPVGLAGLAVILATYAVFFGKIALTER